MHIQSYTLHFIFKIISIVSSKHIAHAKEEFVASLMGWKGRYTGVNINNLEVLKIVMLKKYI